LSEPVSKHAFNAAMERTLNRSLAIGSQRGGEYLDSWHIDNQVTTFIDHVLALPIIQGHEREYKRLLMVASLVDVKDSRMSGPWKSDTTDDGINYRAAFTTWRDEYEQIIHDARHAEKLTRDHARVDHGLAVLARS